MTPDEASEFARFVSEAWQPQLNDTQRSLWEGYVSSYDAKTAFEALMGMFKTDAKRPNPPEFRQVYKRLLIDSTPVAPVIPEARDEIPQWVQGWWLARREGDMRLWPEQRPGYRELHETWLEQIGPKFAKEHGLKSGYEWPGNVMRAADRRDYMARAELGEGPRTADEIAAAIAEAAVGSPGNLTA